jgi:FAD binding domain/Overcoming lysogenization defect protein-like, TOPRIM domain/AAA domain, putative AbiEii toxin, Type IV TA system
LGAVTGPAALPPVLFLPAEARAGGVQADPSPHEKGTAEAIAIFRAALTNDRRTSTAQALSVIDALESCCARGLGGLLLLIEEPELYLRPQAQRYLYRLLREFALACNQVIYSTHSPAFLNVARLDELVFVERLPQTGTRALQPEQVTADEDFRVMTEFDSARSELFLARAVVLVEGLTEKLVLPFVFATLGHDVDREAISIIECGGKPNLPLFARICRAIGVPFVVVHDSDRRASGKLVAAERALNALIADTAGDERTIVLDPRQSLAWRDTAANPSGPGGNSRRGLPPTCRSRSYAWPSARSRSPERNDEEISCHSFAETPARLQLAKVTEMNALAATGTLTQPNERRTAAAVLVIGAGAAGLRAAVELAERGVQVLCVGKRRRDDAHTVLASGGISAALATMDPEDSWEQHAADTLRESYWLADPRAVELLCRGAPDAIEDLVRYA